VRASNGNRLGKKRGWLLCFRSRLIEFRCDVGILVALLG
jgi:hypothetical protein